MTTETAERMTSESTQAGSPIEVEPAQKSQPAQDIEARRVRVALIGCGAIAAQMHLPVLAGHEDIELAVLVDRSLERAQRLADGYGVPRVLADASELDPSRVDAAIVATPPAHHAPCSIDLLQRGIHVLVEKPMATDYARAVEMVEAARQSGAALAVGVFRRLQPSASLLKSLVDSQYQGRPLRFHIEGGGMYNWDAATLANMRRELAGGGVLIDYGSHMVDLLFSVFDEPAQLLDYRDNALGGIEADCEIRLRVQHDGRPVEGTIELARTRNLDNLIRVECERGTLEFRVQDRFRVRVVPGRNLEGEALPQGGEGSDLEACSVGPPPDFWLDAAWRREPDDESWYETFRRQIDDWLDAIRKRREPALSGRSSLATVRLIEQCYELGGGTLDEPWVWEGIQKTPPTTEAGEGNGHRVTAGAAPRRRRVLVTGATGFIGSRVAEILHLRDGWDVRALVHNPGNASRLARLPVEMVQGDLSGSDARQLVEGCDAVVHCAIGTAWGEPRKIFQVTVEGTRQLANAARAAGVRRLVHLSTISVHGDDSAMTGRIDESTPVCPLRGNTYGQSKAEAERVVARAAREGLSTVTLRPARVFGPFSRIFVMRPLQAIAQGNFQWLGSPDVPCDMVYVDNLVEAIVGALEADGAIGGETFAISDGEAMTWRAFYTYFADALGHDLCGAPIAAPAAGTTETAFGRLRGFPAAVLRAAAEIMTSAEFKSLGRRVLQTDPIGTLPRGALERYPAAERAVRRLVRADDALPIYVRQEAAPDDPVEMGSAGALVAIDKARQLLGYDPPVSRERALELTLKWVRDARVAR